ncbi:arsenic metallochaperone ArsD family protein [Lysinibacillus sp. NPDC094403]
MKKIHIYEPAMCCSTGLYGPSYIRNKACLS